MSDFLLLSGTARRACVARVNCVLVYILANMPASDNVTNLIFKKEII